MVGQGGLGGVALHSGKPVIALLKVIVACAGVLVIVEIGKVPLYPAVAGSVPTIEIADPAALVRPGATVTVTTFPASLIETMLAVWLGKLIEPTLLKPLALLN